MSNEYAKNYAARLRARAEPARGPRQLRFFPDHLNTSVDFFVPFTMICTDCSGSAWASCARTGLFSGRIRRGTFVHGESLLHGCELGTNVCLEPVETARLSATMIAESNGEAFRQVHALRMGRVRERISKMLALLASGTELENREPRRIHLNQSKIGMNLHVSREMTGRRMHELSDAGDIRVDRRQGASAPGHQVTVMPQLFRKWLGE